MRYDQGLAGTTFNNYASQLAGLAQFGSQGSANLSNTNSSYADALSNIANNRGSIQAQGILAKTSALNQGWGGMFNFLDQGMSAAMGGMGGAGNVGASYPSQAAALYGML